MDLIDRQKAIDAVAHITSTMSVCLNKYECNGMKRMQNQAVIELAEMPSAQPEIIHCEDCVKCEIDIIYHDYWCNGQKVWKTHYCGYAERRTDDLQ